SVTTGRTYEYRMGMPSPSGTHYSEPVRVSVPGQPRFSLRLRSNPVSKVFAIDLRLAASGSVRVQVLDAAGRTRVDRTSIYDEGNHLITIPLSENFTPGVYFVRATQGQDAAMPRACLVRSS